MTKNVRMYLRTVLIVALFGVFTFALAAQGAQEVCPEEGKVESVVDGDIDNVVLPAGTQVCIKGSTTVVYTTADGTSTLRELLGINKNVSHYTVIEQSTTTTTVVDTTSTTEPEVTTSTTLQPTTTTTEQSTSTSTTTPEASSSTTLPPEVPGPTITPTTQLVTLPMTGNDRTAMLIAAAALLILGSLLAFTPSEDE